jgi:hypothetical protein
LALSAEPEPEPASGGAEAAPARRPSWARLAAFVGLVLLALLLVTAWSRSLPARARAPFDARALARLKRLQPQFVLLGNSMVDTRFDEPTLRHALAPRRVAVLGIAATESAVWYLALKNLVIPSGAQPRVVQFFRDPELTEPRARATGAHHVKLERVSPEDDPVVEKKLALPLTEPVAWLESRRERDIPVERLHEKAEPLLDMAGELCSRLLWRDTEQEARKREINEVFALSNLRAAQLPPDPTFAERTRPFREVVEQSLLPDMCELTRDHGIKLTFVRVRTRAAASGERESSSERQYLGELERYVRACGAEFYDMHDAAWESLDLYGDGDHISGRAKRQYTALFAEHMARIFH